MDNLTEHIKQQQKQIENMTQCVAFLASQQALMAIIENSILQGNAQIQAIAAITAQHGVLGKRIESWGDILPAGDMQETTRGSYPYTSF